MKIKQMMIILSLLFLAACSPAAPMESLKEIDPVVDMGRTLENTPMAEPTIEPDPAATATNHSILNNGRSADFGQTLFVYHEQKSDGTVRQFTFYPTGLVEGSGSSSMSDSAASLFSSIESAAFTEAAGQYLPAEQCPSCMIITLNRYQEGQLSQIIWVDGAPLPDEIAQLIKAVQQLLPE